jgi:hypothetical protein
LYIFMIFSFLLFQVIIFHTKSVSTKHLGNNRMSYLMAEILKIKDFILSHNSMLRMPYASFSLSEQKP